MKIFAALDYMHGVFRRQRSRCSMNQSFGKYTDLACLSFNSKGKIFGVAGAYEGLYLDNRMALMGWGMFLLCGVLWILQAAANSDWIGLLIGATWVLGCGFFLWDLTVKRS